MKAKQILLYGFAALGALATVAVAVAVVFALSIEHKFPKETLSDADVRRMLEQQSLTPQRWLESVEKSGRQMTSYQSSVDWALLVVDETSLLDDLKDGSASRQPLQAVAQLRGNALKAAEYMTRCVENRGTPIQEASRWVIFNASFDRAGQHATGIAILANNRHALLIRC